MENKPSPSLSNPQDGGDGVDNTPEYLAGSTSTGRTGGNPLCGPQEDGVTPFIDVASLVGEDMTNQSTPKLKAVGSKRYRETEGSDREGGSGIKRTCQVQASTVEDRDVEHLGVGRGRHVMFDESSGLRPNQEPAYHLVGGTEGRGDDKSSTDSPVKVLPSMDVGSSGRRYVYEEPMSGKSGQMGLEEAQRHADHILEKFKARACLEPANDSWEGESERGRQPRLSPPTRGQPLSRRPKRSIEEPGKCVPPRIISQIPPVELSQIEAYMRDKGYEVPNWPKEVFVNLYMRKGCKVSIRNYCEAELKHLEMERRYALEHPDPSRARNPMHSSSEEESDHRRQKERIRKEGVRRERSRALSAPLWDQDDEDTRMSEVVELSDIFPEFDDKTKKQLLSTVPRYDPSSRSEQSDWLTWINSVEAELGTLRKTKANYLLLSKAGPKYAGDLIMMFRHDLREMVTRKLIFRLGSAIYKMQGKNPHTLSVNLEINKNGCYDQRLLFERVVQLQYCRLDIPTWQKFAMEVYVVAYFKLKRVQRFAFKQTMFARYPALLRLVEMNTNTVYGPLHAEIPVKELGVGERTLPQTELEMDVYCEQLISAAARESTISWERRHAYSCAKPDDPIYGIEPRKFQAKDSPSKPMNGKTSTVTVAAATFDKAKEGTLPKDHPMDQEYAQTPPAVAQTPPRKKWCPECKSSTHNEVRCWKLHPELKPAFKKRKSTEVTQEKSETKEHSENQPTMPVKPEKTEKGPPSAERSKSRSANKRKKPKSVVVQRVATDASLVEGQSKEEEGLEEDFQ